MRALVITGTDDVFVTGGDVAVDHSRSAPAEMPFHRLRHSPIPVVAAINGFCQASGVLMALLADLAIASDRATFRIPELHAGFPDTWMAAVLPAHVGLTCARELTLTARRVDALEAVRIGLVARVAPHAELSAAVATATAELLRAGPDARIAWRTAADAHYGTIDEHTFDHGAATEEAIEGFRALAGRRRPTWVPRDGARV